MLPWIELCRKLTGGEWPIEQLGDIRAILEKTRWNKISGALLARKLVDSGDDIVDIESANAEPRTHSQEEQRQTTVEQRWQ